MIVGIRYFGGSIWGQFENATSEIENVREGSDGPGLAKKGTSDAPRPEKSGEEHVVLKPDGADLRCPQTGAVSQLYHRTVASAQKRAVVAGVDDALYLSFGHYLGQFFIT